MTLTRATLYEGARLITAIVVILGMVWSIGKPHATELINQTVEQKLHSLEQKIDDAQIRTLGSQTQLSLQQQKLESISKSQDDARTDIRDVQRSLNAILRELRRP